MEVNDLLVKHLKSVNNCKFLYTRDTFSAITKKVGEIEARDNAHIEGNHETKL